MRRLFYVSLIFIVSVLSLRTHALTLPGPLVDSNWLAQHLDEVTVLDVRDDIESFTRRAVLVRKRFTGDLRIAVPGAHIPGAVLVDFQNIRSSREVDGRNVRRMVPEKSEFEQLMRSWGVNKNDNIIIMSQGAGSGDVTMATRLYWQIKYFGHDSLAILDGGMAQWLLDEKPASIEPRKVSPGNWSADNINENINASSEDVARAVADKNVQLVDTRGLGYYLGLYKQTYVRSKGHIPGARVFPDELLTSASTPALFSDADQLGQIAAELGIDTRGDIITYCNSGQLASASWFVFSELLGNKNVKLYDGSMHQWALEKRPVTRMTME